MPADDSDPIEAFFEGLVETVFYGASYFTGALVFALLTLGQIPFAPLSSIHERKRNKKAPEGWSIWLCQPMQKKILRAEVICAVGFFSWIGLGFAINHAVK